MTKTLTIDASGGLFLPAELLADAHLQKGAEVEVDVVADRIVVKPAEAAVPEAQLVERDGMLVFVGGPARSEGEIVRAIKAGRDERDARIARAVRGL
jgi:bifunctional DNA-binding transcriptional regulator/antitoxin component of YhaV-PrlF toxin-antitoxin module